MPIITVWGLPGGMRESASLSEFHEALLAAVLAVKELGLSKKQVTIFYPADLMSFSFSGEIIIFVDGLFPKPERTDEVRDRLAANLGTAAKERFPKELAEVIVKTFDPTKGFWTSEQGG